MALALFDTDKDVVGKALEWKVPGYTEQVMVSGIFEDINPMSSLQFDFVLPYDVYEDFMRSMGSLSWGNLVPGWNGTNEGRSLLL
jgi:hypothetical protein